MTKSRTLYLPTAAAAATLLLPAAAAPEASLEAPAPPAGYRLVWADEFDRDGPPDPKNWKFESGFVRNQEFQWYQAENAVCKNGMLVIEGRRERRPNPAYRAGSDRWQEKREFIDYTAASLKTEGLHSWTYGRFEMRARIDTRPGLWPAFWTLGVNGEWPSCGEIDIMEYYRGNLLANVAWGTSERWKAKWDSSSTPLTKFGDPEEWVRKFHVWRMDWDADSIRLYVDDVLLNETDITTVRNPASPVENPFRQPHYLLLNLAIGGQNGGDPAGTEFPARFEVDYVRVYQRVSPTEAAGTP